MSGRASMRRRLYLVLSWRWPTALTAVTTARAVGHSPCGFVGTADDRAGGVVLARDGAHGGDDCQVCGPFAVRLDGHVERQAGGVDAGARRRGNPCGPNERVPLVGEHESLAIDVVLVRALLF